MKERKKRKILTKEEKEYICEKYKDGVSTEKLALELDIKATAICNNLKKLGVSIRTKEENALSLRKNLENQRFGRLIAIKPTKIKKDTAWVCQCDCGIIKSIKTENLTSGDTKSCGCLNSENCKNNLEKSWTRKTKFTPEIATARRIWRSRYKDISFEDFYEMSQLNCFYCNKSPSNIGNCSGEYSSEYFQENGNFKYNGLDRLDSSLPHSKENCVPCCKYCNYAKRERSVNEFIEWIKSLYLNLKNKNLIE